MEEGGMEKTKKEKRGVEEIFLRISLRFGIYVGLRVEALLYLYDGYRRRRSHEREFSVPGLAPHLPKGSSHPIPPSTLNLN